ncbi:MAG: dTDP-4-dehydrorhamnose reductase, partial [Candidatus Zixiibacteriota bacterium]
MGVRLLVTGSAGQLGTEFCNTLSEKFDMAGISRKDADIRDYGQVMSAVNKHRPEIIIHTAALTDVDACEKDQSAAMEINASGARNVALAAQKAGAAIIYFSTDYVFDGSKNTAYTESDSPNPISQYGFSKLMGEKIIMEFHGNWTIIRTGWVYSQHGKNFIKSIISTAKKKEKTLQVVNDQFGSPTWTKDIVLQTAGIIESNESGLFHVTSKGEMSRYELAGQVLNKLIPTAKIEPCQTQDFPRPALRPARSSLRSERLESLGIDIMRPIQASLDEFLNQYGEELLHE